LRIAAALEVSVADLTGQPYVPRDREHADAQRGVGGLRLALLDPDGALSPEPSVVEAVDQLPTVLTRCDLVEQGRILPDLLRWTQQYAALSGAPDAHRRVARVAYTAAFFLRNLGEMDLALMTAERMVRAAAESQDRATLGLAAYAQAHALAPAGALRRAVKIADDGFAVADGSDEECLASRGSCLLVSATSASALGDFDTAREQIEDAGRIADLVDGPTVVAGHTSFSSWNVAMHRVAVEVEAGNPSAALEAAEPLGRVELAQKERVSYFWVDMGRAYSLLDRHREAIDAFRRAERAAPLRVRLSPVVRDSVRDLMDRAYRRAVGVELRGLAERCGVLPG
jgi:tetratricopeptide (TPR) repeat protein